MGISYLFDLINVLILILQVSPPMDRTKYVEDWTAKHSHYPSEDTSSLSRRKLPSAPGSSSPESASEGRDLSFDGTSNTNKDRKTSMDPFERFRNISMPKRSITGAPQGSARTDLESKLKSRDEVMKQSLKKSFNSSGSGPSSAWPGSSASPGYQSRLDVGRLSTRNKQVTSSLSKTPCRSNSSLTSHEADFQAWKRRKEYKPFTASER